MAHSCRWTGGRGVEYSRRKPVEDRTKETSTRTKAVAGEVKQDQFAAKCSNLEHNSL